MGHIEVVTIPVDESKLRCTVCGSVWYKTIKIITYKGEKIELNLCSTCCRELAFYI